MVNSSIFNSPDCSIRAALSTGSGATTVAIFLLKTTKRPTIRLCFLASLLMTLPPIAYPLTPIAHRRGLPLSSRPPPLPNSPRSLMWLSESRSRTGPTRPRRKSDIQSGPHRRSNPLYTSRGGTCCPRRMDPRVLFPLRSTWDRGRNLPRRRSGIPCESHQRSNQPSH